MDLRGTTVKQGPEERFVFHFWLKEQEDFSVESLDYLSTGLFVLHQLDFSQRCSVN